MKKPIVILTATALEQEPLRARLTDRELIWVVGGMGAGATAAATLRAIRDLRPGLVIQAGIAGALPRKHLSAGDTVLVGNDRQADLGAWRPETGRFEAFDSCAEAQTVACPYTEPLRGAFRIIAARSVNSACAPLPLRDDEALESMEGAAFFAVCRDEGVPFLQLRAVSNHVGDPRSEWRIPEALESLASNLECLLKNLNGG